MYLISGYTLIMLQVLCFKFSRYLTELWTLRRLRSRLHTTVSFLTDFDHLLNSKLPLIVRKMLYTLTVGLENASRRFSGTLNSKSRQGQSSCQRRRSKKFSRASFCWPPMTICGKNVDTLRPCKRSNRDFFWL